MKRDSYNSKRVSTLKNLWKENIVKPLKMKQNNKECKMVRIPKEMYDSILEIISLYPEYGWKGPAEFVRDAVRRYLEEIRCRERFYRSVGDRLPRSILEVLREAVGDKLAKKIELELENIELENLREYYYRVVNVLSKYMSKNSAELIAKRILEIIKEEIKYSEESEE